MRPTPYIGITGFMGRLEVYKVLASRSEEYSRRLMVGVLASTKSLRGDASNPNRYPAKDVLNTIFPDPSDDPRVLNILHYNSNMLETLDDDLVFAQSLAGPHCNGYQLNITWPPKTSVAYYKQQLMPEDHKVIILQCGRRALAQVDNSPKLLAERVAEYSFGGKPTVDYVLFDQSGGEGKEFDLDLAGQCFEELEKIPDIGLGVAGGLTPYNLNRLDPLLERFSYLNIDVETGVRDEEDHLDVAEAIKYLNSADTLLSQE